APDNGVGTLIYVSSSAGGAVNRGSSWVLVRNEPYPVRIKNASELWVSSTVLNQFVDLSIEQKR
ncbi:MAG: hypothetical protein Q8R28_09725, partial [Dehalococcoidia bacterium]|nr:hypothetical protein [Dehalococcoidia bacterium]